MYVHTYMNVCILYANTNHYHYHSHSGGEGLFRCEANATPNNDSPIFLKFFNFLRSPPSPLTHPNYTTFIHSHTHHPMSLINHKAALSALLAAGHTRKDSATQLGITPSAVTQLAAQDDVKEAIRTQQLKRATELDAKYDAIEDKLLSQLERTVPLLMRPGEIAKVLQVVNGAKRRGSIATTPTGPAQILQLNLPIAIQNRFVVNSSNQVVSAGAQDLITISTGGVQKLLEASNAPNKPTIYIEDEFGFESPASDSTDEE